ncbi:hypothetical protein BJ991_002386 [Microbacterium immunditiarum]|uniref:Uncharacterized protein n=1 Tax=Microbacterium immunditiarum TaxID=337480 RepID=A0A7Y9GPM8_9MICO|nr:hypothetical protein [Microbacterium immunditiarum]
MGTTRVPYSSIERMSFSWASVPFEYLRSKRAIPSVRIVSAILAATVSGEPTYSAPSGPTSCWKRRRLYVGQPRSFPIVLYMPSNDGYASSHACWSVSAM